MVHFERGPRERGTGGGIQLLPRFNKEIDDAHDQVCGSGKCLKTKERDYQLLINVRDEKQRLH